MKRVYPREDVCMACRLCEVFCLTEHSRSRDIIKAYRKEIPRPLPRLKVQEKGILSFALQCRHCAEPACLYACLTGAISKDPNTGIVSLDESKCVGCWTCILACPYGAIFPDPARKVATKCDLCSHLATPACVAHCPNEALCYRDEEVS